MFGGGPGRMMGQEALKPRDLGGTLARFGRYFQPYWPALAATLALVILATWSQVMTPDLAGQLVDCYLTPGVAGAQQGATAAPSGATAAPSGATAAQSNCWLAEGVTPDDVSRQVIRAVVASLGAPRPAAGGAALTPEQRIAGLGALTLVLIGLFVLASVTNGLTFYCMTWAGQHVLRGMRLDVFKHAHALSLNYYAEHEAGDLMSRITNDTETIAQAFGFALVQVVGGVMLLVWIALTMLSRSVPFALISMAVVPVMAVITVWFSSQARKAFRQARQRIGAVNAELQETISAVREAQAFNRIEENIESFKVTNAANRDANVRAVSYTSALGPALEALGFLAVAVVAVVGGLALVSGQTLAGTAVSLGLVITFIGYVQRFNQPIQQISTLWTNLQNAVAGGERIFNLLEVKPEVLDKPDARPMPAIQGRVVFDAVTAAYKKDEMVLKGVSFEARPGQTIAIIGPTGAGKTTIINLIPRFYDVTGGAVRIDGIDVRDVTQDSLRRQIGIVLQDTFLFSTTVMDNIRFGRPDATDEEVRAAAVLARADTFIDRLPDKYQTVLGERGTGLSQGQRQLIAIARAALADPRILILDEATSSVDTRTERLIQQALDRLLQGRTSFVIAHRLSTIQHADMLLVLKDGEIIERGRHDELLARRGFYYSLYMSQFWHGAPGDPNAGGDGHARAELAPAA